MTEVCEALYEDTFRFVKRHPPRVVIPRSAERHHDLLIAATFGAFPEDASLADFRKYYEKALGATEEKINNHLSIPRSTVDFSARSRVLSMYSISS